MRTLLLLDLSFLAADLVAVRLLRAAWLGADADLFQLLLYAAFLAYALAFRSTRRMVEVHAAWQKLDAAHHDALFLFRVLHILAMLALPVALFVARMESGARGDDMLLLASFLLLPVLAIVTIVQIAQDPAPGKTPVGLPGRVLTRLGFLYSFAFFTTIGLEAGDLLVNEVAGTARTASFFLMQLAVRLVFLALVFLPMRSWLALPELARGARGRWSLVVTSLVILANGLFRGL